MSATHQAWTISKRSQYANEIRQAENGQTYVSAKIRITRQKQQAMSVLKQNIAAPLLTFIEPQIEQLHIDLKPLRYGIYGTIDNALGSGFLWAASFDDDCLIAHHRIVLNKPTVLDERPDQYCCITSSSEATINSSEELLKITNPQKSENLCTFSSNGGDISCLLKAHVPYDSVSISYTPHFFQKLKNQYPGQFDHIEEEMDTLAPSILPDSLRVLLRTFKPERAALPGAELFFRAKTLEALSLLMPAISQLESTHSLAELADTRLPYDVSENELEGALQARINGANAEYLQLVNEAKNFIDDNLSHHITLDDVAKHLYVSRSKLCAVFQEETGTTLGIYLRKQRIAQACDLLVHTSLSISDIGHVVGYPRASSFTEAFVRETGHTPSSYRAHFTR